MKKTNATWIAYHLHRSDAKGIVNCGNKSPTVVAEAVQRANDNQGMTWQTATGLVEALIASAHL